MFFLLVPSQVNSLERLLGKHPTSPLFVQVDTINLQELLDNLQAGNWENIGLEKSQKGNERYLQYRILIVMRLMFFWQVPLCYLDSFH